MREKTTVFLAATAQDCAAAQRCGGPCVRLIYRVGDGGILQRAQAPLAGRGGLLGLYEAPGLPAAQPEKLARDLQAECARRGFSGVVLDLEPTAEMLPRLEELCAALRRLQVRHFVPESLHAAAPQGIVLLPAAVSGGSFGEMLDALCARYGAENLCLDLVRSRSDFSMPSYDPSGTPLSREELERLRETHRAESFYSPQLCCRYFTYRNRSGAAHFVLFDDGDTARNKLAEIRKRGIPWVILLYSEWGPEARELLAGEAAPSR